MLWRASWRGGVAADGCRTLGRDGSNVAPGLQSERFRYAAGARCRRLSVAAVCCFGNRVAVIALRRADGHTAAPRLCRRIGAPRCHSADARRPA